jgi:microcystin-dependent protein
MVQDYSKNLIYGNFLGMDNRAFPIDCETLATLQSNAKKFAATALIAGCERLILTGCQQSGTVRKEGYVFIVNTDNPLTGEVLYHPEQPAKDHCHVKESPVDVTADGTDYPAAYTERYLEEGLVEGAWLWSSFTRIEDISNAALKGSLDTVNNALNQKIESLKNNAQYTFVRGMILMWSGYVNEIPDGWALCDGQNGTPPLSGRFVVCVKAMGVDPSGNPIYNKGYKDGAESQNITLTVNNLPKHKHSGNTDYAGNHRHSFEDAYYAENRSGQSGTYFGSDEGYDQDNVLFTRTAYTEYAPTHKHTFNTDEVGGGQSFTVNTMPPYYALAYIMKL